MRLPRLNFLGSLESIAKKRRDQLEKATSDSISEKRFFAMDSWEPRKLRKFKKNSKNFMKPRSEQEF